ncbi:MAG: formate dehydrogenase accessory sulfurtransferase FdhD [Chitinivibrionales bacterium]|nr:formate dehydrogenase accessory sulfurtransferase FdhD [Chitinivibrionales bacterium]
MNERRDFGATVEMTILQVKNGAAARVTRQVPTEVPFTILVNDLEIATLLCSPVDLKELVYGFLFSSGFIKTIRDIHHYTLDATRWVAHLTLAHPPDTAILHKRMYTSGCGKGIMYASVGEIAFRQPVENTLQISHTKITALAHWLQHCSEQYKNTGGIHTAALSIDGEPPAFHFDDIGRHNAVDKTIGRGLIDGSDFSRGTLVCSGRTSSEILHKARVCAIPIVLSRGAPTHQAVLRAAETGVTLICRARGNGYNIHTHENRIINDDQLKKHQDGHFNDFI